MKSFIFDRTAGIYKALLTFRAIIILLELAFRLHHELIYDKFFFKLRRLRLSVIRRQEIDQAFSIHIHNFPFSNDGYEVLSVKE